MESKKLCPAPKVREIFGITPMTEWRWTKRGILPAPIKINERNYYDAEAVYALASGKTAKSEKQA